MIFHDVQQGSDEWLELRLGKATSSNYALFMANYGKPFGEPAKRYALQLALERVRGSASINSYTNEHMQRGIEQEPIARMLYEDMNFVDVRNGGFFDHGDYGDSPDGLVGDDGLIEIKSVIASTHYETMKRGFFDPAYQWQILGHLDCTGRDWCDFISYCADFPKDKQLIVHRIDLSWRHLLIERLKERRTEFIELVKQIEGELRE